MNDSSKRHSQFVSLIFILNCLTKASVIRIHKQVAKLQTLNQFKGFAQVTNQLR